MDLPRLVHRFRGPLIGFFAAQGADPREARELAQDALAEAFLARDRFRGDPDDLNAQGAWLRGIAKNLSRVSFRDRAKQPRELPFDEVVDSSDRDPAAVALMTERRSRVLLAIDELRPAWRAVLYMHYIEGSGLAEVGALIGLSDRAVEGRLRRARAELKRILESWEVQP